MMECLKLIVDKLSQYNFLTNILPGTVLCIILKYIVGYDLIPADYYQAALIFYFVGMVNSRVGSLVVEPFLKYIRWVVFSPYKDFVNAEKKDPKLSILNGTNNEFRSYISVMFVSIVAYLYKNYLVVFDFIHNHEIIILLGLLFIIFLCSYRKQTNYIRKRVQANTEQPNIEQQTQSN